MKGRWGKLSAQWHLFPKKRRNSLGVRLWNWAVNAWPIDRPDPEPATETLTRRGPPLPLPGPSRGCCNLRKIALTMGRTVDNILTGSSDHFSRPIEGLCVPKKKFDGTKKSLNRSINGREEKRIKIERRFARVKISFHSGWAKIITRWEKSRYRTFEIYKASTSCENDSSSFSQNRLNFLRRLFMFFFNVTIPLRKLAFLYDANKNM